MATLAPSQPDLFGRSELEQISEPTARLVFDALANPKWDFRTVDGIAKETHLSTDEVKQALVTLKNLVRKSLVPDRSGRALYTLSVKPVPASEKKALIRLFLTKSL